MDRLWAWLIGVGGAIAVAMAVILNVEQLRKAKPERARQEAAACDQSMRTSSSPAAASVADSSTCAAEPWAGSPTR